MKTCSKCKTEKNETEFYRDRLKPGGFRLECKQCKNEAHSRWVAENRQRLNAYTLARYYKEYPDRGTKHAAARAEAKALRLGRIKEIRREQWARFKALHPERYRVYNASKHARRRERIGSLRIPTDEMILIRERAKGRCYWCSKKRRLTFDHYVPLASGGTHTASNLVMACRPCNLTKNKRTPFEFAAAIGRLL